MNTTTEYSKGRVAYAMDVLYTECPYIMGTDEWQNWCSGWLDAEDAYLNFIQTPGGP